MNINKKKILVFAPHQDDELALAGQIIVEHKNKENIYICFVTNGDALLDDKLIRLREAIDVLCFLGIPEKNIIFLGYGNRWKGDLHIYNCEKDSVVESLAGNRQTIALKTHPEYSYYKRGIHSTYTKNNIIRDVMNVIEDIMPDILICPDYDKHVDHRAVSLFCEYTLGIILKKYPNYRPIFLKKFVYNGAWHGKNDYYFRCKTRNILKNNKTENPIFHWSDRVSIKTCRECLTILLKNNILYKAAQKYNSQRAWESIGRMCNRDIVYWKRCTENVLLHAEINVSSGNGKCLNDFVITDSIDILGEKIQFDDSNIWSPNDEDKIAVITLSNPVVADQIVFYENPNKGSDIDKIKITIEDEEIVLDYQDIDHSGYRNIVHFKEKVVNFIKVQLLEVHGCYPGITEIEMVELENVLI